MKEKSLIVTKEEGVFTKIKKIFQKLFKKEQELKVEEVNYKEEKSITELKNKFKQEMRIDTKEELKRLQYKLKTKQMQIADLTEKQKDDLIELYNEQIKIKKERLLGLYKKIEKLKKVEGNI